MKSIQNSILKFGVVLCLITFGTVVRAIEPVVQDRDVMEKAKGKKYRNGAEEGELRVQAQLYKPQRKIAPVVDKKEAEPNQEHD